MALAIKLVCSLLLTSLLTSSLVAEQLHARSLESQWSKRTSNAGSDWIPLSAPCTSCQPNDRISSESDHVASLLTPPLPDYQLNYQPQKQFQGQQGPIAQQLVRQKNGHQQFVSPVKPKFPPLSQPLQVIPPNIAKVPNEQKPFAPTATPQFVQQPYRNFQLPVLQNNPNLATDGPNQFNQPQIQQEFPLQEPSFTQLVGQDSQIQFNIDPNQKRNSPYQNFLGQFFQPQQTHLNLNQQSNESQLSSSNEEKPEVQLVYVPVEALSQNGRFNLPYKTGSKTLTELKSDLLVQQEPSTLAAEESRQQRQHFQPYFEQQYPLDQLQPQRPNAVRGSHFIVSTEQPKQNQGIEVHQQTTHEERQVNKPQHIDTPQRTQDQNQQQFQGQQILQPLRAQPTGIPQQLQHPQLQVSDVQVGVPIQDPYSTRVPQLQRQNQQQSQDESLINQDHFLKYLRPLPTVAAQLLQEQQQQHIQGTQPPPTSRLHASTISHLQQRQPSHDHRFLQTQQPFFASTFQGQQQQEFVTENPQLPGPHFLETQRASAQQQLREAVTTPVTQQTLLESQPLLQSTKTPQLQKSDQRHSQQSTTAKPSKPIPHQPPLSVYMGRDGQEINIADVIKVLKNAKTIAVLDSVGPESPQIFVGPSNLKPPSSYAKFELPYLSSIESNRVERKVDKFPFFVAPLNFNPPAGYSKIPFPSPHIGSVVVSNVSEPDSAPEKGDVGPSTVKPHRGRFSSQYSLPADLPAINPQLPTLVNSLQDSKQPGNVFLTATREQTITKPHPTERPYQPIPVQHLQQVPHQQNIQQFQEIHQVSEAPLSSHITQAPDTPQINQYSNFQHVTTTPQTHRFPFGTQHVQNEQFSQVELSPEFTQTIPTPPAPQRSQFPQNYLREEQQISQLGQFLPQTRPISPSNQNPQLQLTESAQTTAIPSLQNVSTLKRVPQHHKSQQVQENNNFSSGPEIQPYQRENVAPTQHVNIRTQEVKKEEQQQDLPSTPLPRIPKRRPSYRARQRTTEAPTTEESSTTTRRPYTRGRRPNTIRHRGQPQETQNQHDSPSTITTRNQFQADAEPPSTTEFFTGFKYTTRAPTRSRPDIIVQDTKAQAQEEKPRRNNVLRTRIRTRERNSQRVTGQNVPSYQTQLSEKKPQNFNLQDEQDTVVPPHESKRQQSTLNQYYNTERSGFEVPTTENSKFEQINSNLPQQISHDDEIAYQQQLGLKVQSALPVSPTISTATAYQANVNAFPEISTSQSYENTFQEVINPISATTAHPELNSFVPRQTSPSGERHHVRGHPQLVNEQPVRFPQFTLPVQVSVSGQTEVPEIEETPRPVYVRIRGHTRGRRPQTHDTAGTQRAVPKYQQQQEARESPQTYVPQEQGLAYQNQSPVPSSSAGQRGQHQVPRQRVLVSSGESVEDEEKVDSSKPIESGEEYGFTRPISFPASISTVNYQETGVRSRQPNYFEESQSQDSQASVEDLEQNAPINSARQNVPVSSNKPPGVAIEEPTTPVATVFTIRPSRRHPSVKQQMRITSIRGRMRRPTTSTTEQSLAVTEELQPNSIAPQLIRRRPVNRFSPSLTSNEVSGESQEAFVTPRSSLQRYETPIRGTAAVQKHIVSNEDQAFVEPSSTASTFQITLLDDPPNYPPGYNKPSYSQNVGNTQQDRYEPVASFNRESLHRYLNEDPEGGAESQWATKRLPFVFTGQDGSTIALITFTTELPSTEQTVTEVPLLPSKENITIITDQINLDNVETSNKTELVHQEVEAPTTVYPTEFSSQVFHVESDKTLNKDLKDLSSTQKKASDHNLDKKSSASRRGTWVRVRKVQRPQDFLETAESQNIGALSRNQLQAMVSKGSMIHSWPAPSPAVGLDEAVPHPDRYATLDENADDDLINSTSVHNNSSEIEHTFVNDDIVFVENLSTTTEENSVTEEYRHEETTTPFPRPTEDPTINTRVLKEIVSLTTESPVIETSTNVHLTETIESTKFNESRSNFTSDDDLKLNNDVNDEAHASPDDQMADQSKDKSAPIDDGYKNEMKNYNNVKTVEVAHDNIDNENIFETTTGFELKPETNEKTTESSVDYVKDNSSEETTSAISYKSNDRANEEHLSIQSSVRDAIQQNSPTEVTTDTPDIIQAIEGMLSESATTTEDSLSDINSPDDIIRTSMRTEISHETEICFRGRCVKTKATDNDHLRE